jgi:ligand-binding sensor domain-containing protein
MLSFRLEFKKRNCPFQYLVSVFVPFLFLFLYKPTSAQNVNRVFSPPQIVYLKSCPPTRKIEVKSSSVKISSPFLYTDMAPTSTANFINFDVQDGLALSSVSCGLKDKKGVLWFGTFGAGISSYNGKSFTTYSTAQGLSNSTIRSIFQDKINNIWFAADFGLNVYDGKALKELKVFKNKYISCITKATDGNFWLTVNNEVYKYSHDLSGKPENGTFRPILLPEKYKNFGFAKILEDRKGNVWLVSKGNGVLCYTGKAFPFDTTRFVSYTNQEEFVNNQIKCVVEDSIGNIWFGTDKGAVRFDGKLFVNFNTSYGLSDNVILTIENDREGNLWFGTNNGVSVCNKEQLLSSEIKFSSPSSSEPLKQSIFSITEDGWGNMWFGTFGAGLYRYNGSAVSNYIIDKKKSSKSNVRSVLEDRNGNLWFGAFGAKVTFFDGDSFTGFDVPWKSSNSSIMSIFEDETGLIWFGTSDRGFFSCLEPV